jgi:hypothetical protein
MLPACDCKVSSLQPQTSCICTLITQDSEDILVPVLLPTLPHFSMNQHLPELSKVLRPNSQMMLLCDSLICCLSISKDTLNIFRINTQRCVETFREKKEKKDAYKITRIIQKNLNHMFRLLLQVNH